MEESTEKETPNRVVSVLCLTIQDVLQAFAFVLFCLHVVYLIRLRCWSFPVFETVFSNDTLGVSAWAFIFANVVGTGVSPHYKSPTLPRVLRGFLFFMVLAFRVGNAFGLNDPNTSSSGGVTYGIVNIVFIMVAIALFVIRVRMRKKGLTLWD